MMTSTETRPQETPPTAERPDLFCAGSKLFFVLAFIPVILLALSAQGEVTTFPVRPSATDPEIKRFNDTHWIYLDRNIVVKRQGDGVKDRHELLLWLTGTGGTGHSAQGFSKLAAELGYHVVTLMYPNDIPASACAGDRNPKAFEAFRMAIIQGGRAPYQGGRQELTIARAESIENRLIKVLQSLQQKRAREN